MNKQNNGKRPGLTEKRRKKNIYSNFTTKIIISL